MKKYPYWKVGIGFVLCPGVIGIFMDFIYIYEEIKKAIAVGKFETPYPYYVYVYSYTILFPLYAIFIEIVPSVALSAVYLILKLRRVWWSYVFVIFSGGIGSFLWNYYAFNDTRHGWDFVKNFKISDFIYLFILGGISSFITALLVFPKGEVDVVHKQSH